MRQGNSAGRGRGKQDDRKKPTTRKPNSNRPKKKFSQNVENERKFYKPGLKQAETVLSTKDSSEGVRLNKFIAATGLCSRREADVHIASGMVAVNGKVMVEMGYKVQPTDVVKYNGETIKGEGKVYLLLNKPKGFITTMDDPKARKTVMDLVGNACKERIYPVGRLDRATTGILLFTNDGEIAQKLTHPSHGARKIYAVTLDKALTHSDYSKILAGLQLEDGLAPVDRLEYISDKDKKHLGIELHIGRNRIVRRIFKELGYEVTKLDRTLFHTFTKKNLKRGDYRFLNAEELKYLKMK
jgi:23S rRNA pseudouridine2605 synthase